LKPAIPILCFKSCQIKTQSLIGRSTAVFLIKIQQDPVKKYLYQELTAFTLHFLDIH
jgi:hypothetical protein